MGTEAEASPSTVTPEAGYARLSPTDLMFLRLETEAWPCHFGALVVIDGDRLLDDSGQLRMQEIRNRLARRVNRVPKLRRRLYRPGILGGPPVWITDNRFSIDRHLHAATVDSPGGEEQLMEKTVRVYEGLLDRERPLWEMWLLDGLEDNRIGVLFKLHHSMADGLAAVSIMGSLFDLDPDAPDPDAAALPPEPQPARRQLRRENLSKKKEAVGRAIRSMANPRLIAGRVRQAAHMSRKYFGKAAVASSSLNQPVSSGRLVRFMSFSLAEARQAAHAHDGKINDIILTVWSGGLRHLLTSRGEPVDGVDVVAGVAATLRPRKEAEGVDNQVGTLVLPLSISDPGAGRRLDQVISVTKRVKGEQRPAATMGYLAGLAATPIGKYFVANQRSTNVIVSNVIGPPVPIYFLGAQVHEILPIIELVGNIGITLCAFSYAGRISMVVTADATSFSDLEVLIEGMERDWQALRPTHS